MIRSHHFIPSFIATAAFVALPLAAAAQEPSTQPATYLDHASQALGSVPKSVQHDATKPMDALRQHFDELSKEYRQERDTIGPPVSSQDPNKEERTWREAFSDVERDLAVLIGGGSSLTATSAIGAQTMIPSPPAQSNVEVTTMPATGGTAVGTTGTSVPGVNGSTPAPPPGTPVASATTGTTPSTTSSVAPAGSANPATTSTGLSSSGQAVTPEQMAQPIGQGTAASGAATTGASAEVTNAGSLAAAGVSAIGLTDLKPALRTQLEQFRLQVEMFYSSTMMAPTGGVER